MGILCFTPILQPISFDHHETIPFMTHNHTMVDSPLHIHKELTARHIVEGVSKGQYLIQSYEPFLIA